MLMVKLGPDSFLTSCLATERRDFQPIIGKLLGFPDFPYQT